MLNHRQYQTPIFKEQCTGNSKTSCWIQISSFIHIIGHYVLVSKIYIKIIFQVYAKKIGSGYIYMTMIFFKSRVSSFFNIFRVAKKFINFISLLIPEPIYPKPSPYTSFYFGLFFMQSRKYSLSYVAVAIFT